MLTTEPSGVRLATSLIKNPVLGLLGTVDLLTTITIRCSHTQGGLYLLGKCVIHIVRAWKGIA